MYAFHILPLSGHTGDPFQLCMQSHVILVPWTDFRQPGKPVCASFTSTAIIIKLTYYTGSEELKVKNVNGEA